MRSAVRSTLQASSRLALRSRPCPGCSSYGLVQSKSPSRQRRQYTTTPRRNALGQPVPGVQARLGKEITKHMGQSHGSKMKGVKKSQLPNDLGLFPGTFTQDRWRAYIPLITSDPKLWFKIQWKILRKPFMNSFGIIYNLYWTRRQNYRYFSTAPLRKKPIPIHFATRISDALTMHKKLNTAIATGDKAWLRAHCCVGLVNRTLARIDRRSVTPRDPEHWELVSYAGWFNANNVPRWPLSSMIPNKSYKVINDTVGQLPMTNDALLRQVTVRISSEQRFTLKDAQGKMQEPQTKKVTEHIVLQKIIWQGEDEPWKVWGTINPSTLEEIKTQFDEEKAAGGLADRMKAMMPSNFGANNMM